MCPSIGVGGSGRPRTPRAIESCGFTDREARAILDRDTVPSSAGYMPSGRQVGLGLRHEQVRIGGLAGLARGALAATSPLGETS